MVVGSPLELEQQPEPTEHAWCARTARQHEVAASAKATLAATSTSAKWLASSGAWLGPARAPPPLVIGIRKGPRPAFRWSSEPVQHMAAGRGFEPSMLAMDEQSQGCKPVMTSGNT